ncbi:MAG: hypothetical protein AUH29_09505 [Candidatus Rokubacteria bacterium 13_1_40CM_69_27]|nr:MAG: hypothetical protein AUH29_09505 [Candidatus Rokubacteria bacterium 13_1_40CM_69_27]OLC38992.1 MAG: hypothetical protein AUH81_02975 [Candidatus Rokubacteria bacterium 13_1_40CM_4_69_5]
MAKTSWRISGDYFETCSCDFLCPCMPSNLAARPTQGHCNFAFVFHVDQGHYGDIALDGLNFAVVGHAPGVMAQGNWSVGVIADARASADQQQAITAIVSGQAGGPMAAVAPLLGKFLGVESKPIRYSKDGLKRSVSIPEMLDQAVEGVPGAKADEPLYIDNTIHPANSRLALAKAVRSHVHAFGITWDTTSGRNNGHFAPFAWQA